MSSLSGKRVSRRGHRTQNTQTDIATYRLNRPQWQYNRPQWQYNRPQWKVIPTCCRGSSHPAPRGMIVLCWLSLSISLTVLEYFPDCPQLLPWLSLHWQSDSDCAWLPLDCLSTVVWSFQSLPAPWLASDMTQWFLAKFGLIYFETQNQLLTLELF